MFYDSKGRKTKAVTYLKPTIIKNYNTGVEKIIKEKNSEVLLNYNSLGLLTSEIRNFEEHGFAQYDSIVYSYRDKKPVFINYIMKQKYSVPDNHIRHYTIKY